MMKHTVCGFIVVLCFLLIGCGGGSSGGSSPGDDNSQSLTQKATGTVSISLTDGPSEELSELVLHFTHIDFGHEEGSVERVQLTDGAESFDLLRLQNGNSASLLARERVPAGRYKWLELGVDLQKSQLQLQNGAAHNMRMGNSDTMRIDALLEIGADDHSEYVIDLDARRSVLHHDGPGMMGSEFEFHPNMRVVERNQTGSLTGTVHMSMIDVYQDGCDSGDGGNWAYLYDGDAMEPDDFAESESDGLNGPIAMDRVELDSETGAYHFHFSYLPEGSYRVAFSCSGEWDEAGDDDYPVDPNGRFGFHGFSDALEVRTGEMTEYHMAPAN